MASTTEEFKKYTLLRNIPSSADDMPDAFLFSSSSLISLEEAKSLMIHPEVLSVFPFKKGSKERHPAMAIIYSRPDFGESRVLVTCVPYYAHPVTDAHREHVIMYEDDAFEGTPFPPNRKKGEIVSFEYGKTLDDCTEIYRPLGCQGCPKRGLECIQLNLGYRPWSVRYPYNRKSEDSTGLIDPGEDAQKEEFIKEHELQGSSYADIVKLYKSKVINGYSFVDPSKTKLDNTSKMNRPLRPARDHRFSTPPAATDTAATK